jgi:hypothetical protein
LYALSGYLFCGVIHAVSVLLQQHYLL